VRFPAKAKLLLSLKTAFPNLRLHAADAAPNFIEPELRGDWLRG
jgi:hypothetical protein